MKRRAPVLLTLALVGCSTLTACTSGGSSSAAGPEAQATAPGLTVAGEWPLTGEKVSGTPPTHPVMVVKIDNSENSSPQIGLSRADLITEELVEGGITRLAVFYYQHTPKQVGPVRSMRATDIGIVKPAKAVLVASGGAPPTIRRLRAAGIKAFTEGAVGFGRDQSRGAPYNLFMHLDRLARTLKAPAAVPSYLPFGPAGEKIAGGPATALQAVFSGGHTTSWRYEGGRYVNENSNAARGDRFVPDSVLVLRVRVGDAGYVDPAGNPVPETHLFGKGPAMLFHDGRMVRGTWSKSLDSTIRLRTAKGGELQVPAGHTWIELVPRRGGHVVVSK